MVCSFNIQFLGNSKVRDNSALASILKGYDVVVIQELVAPPYSGTFPNGEAYKPDPEAAKFFDAMRALGFSYVLSEEDTGTGDKIHNNGTATEWWVAFYHPGVVRNEGDVQSQFLAEDRSNHPDYERVPYAFAFRTVDGKLDFVLVSVHLKPDSGAADKARRAHELASIASWVHAHDDKEKDFIILGDMNIEDAGELAGAVPPGFASLNSGCRPTNTNVNGPKPYDHVLFNPVYTTEIDQAFGMVIVNLVEAMRAKWSSGDAYPGDPYDHDRFRMVYSDHDPVVFEMKIPENDDD